MFLRKPDAVADEASSVGLEPLRDVSYITKFLFTQRGRLRIQGTKPATYLWISGSVTGANAYSGVGNQEDTWVMLCSFTRLVLAQCQGVEFTICPRHNQLSRWIPSYSLCTPVRVESVCRHPSDPLWSGFVV